MIVMSLYSKWILMSLYNRITSVTSISLWVMDLTFFVCGFLFPLSSVNIAILLDYSVLEIKSVDMVKLLLAVSAYHHPDTIQLPDHYHPPHLAISSMYWKSWLLMLVMAAYSPSTFGE